MISAHVVLYDADRALGAREFDSHALPYVKNGGQLESKPGSRCWPHTRSLKFKDSQQRKNVIRTAVLLNVNEIQQAYVLGVRLTDWVTQYDLYVRTLRYHSADYLLFTIIYVHSTPEHSQLLKLYVYNCWDLYTGIRY